MSFAARHPPTRVLIAALLAACADNAGPALDRTAPGVQGVVLAHDGTTLVLPAAQVYAPGQPVWLLLDVTDERRVGWIGFHVTGPIDRADSVAVPDSLQRLRVLVGIDLGSLSGLVEVRGFALDGAGNRTERVVAGNPVSVYAPVVRPLLAVPLPGPVAEVAYDANRDQLLLAEPDESRIAVFPLFAEAYGPAIAAPRPPGAMDFTVTGDSLVVLFPATGELGIFPLVGAAPAWRLVDLPLAGAAAGALRVSAANKVLVASGQVVEFDIATGDVRLRTDAGNQGTVPPLVALGGPADRSTVVLALEAGGAALGQVYDAATATFAAPHALGTLPTLDIAADLAGRLLIGGTLFDAALAPLRRFYPPGQGRVAALTAAGNYAYFAEGSGYLRTRVADGVTLERVVLPEVPERLLVLPGLPERVVAVGHGQLVVVE